MYFNSQSIFSGSCTGAELVIEEGETTAMLHNWLAIASMDIQSNSCFWCDGHATIFKFNLNSFDVHALTYIVLPLSPFLSTAVKIYFLCMLI